ncbi:hypothetical protein [Sphingomonas oligophenolica]|uniref:Uncharacterized protein n=1 Tax=Sphingomonas oligophenolica TaxID=301154 RepID=A0A502C8N7_9SPHN|nr:hypothetical protein [Sphingomonas oligophenolica]TPG09965.1 hypothetical protein EAH84_13355 [Sphingomonas oligophenolica]
MTGETPEDELATRQDPRLFTVGRALRATYDADNHDSLDPVATGLMLDLARVEPPVAPRIAEAGAGPVRATWMARILGLLPRRH